MEKKFYEIPLVESYQISVEAGYSATTGGGKTDPFDGEWIPIKPTTPDSGN